MNTDATPEHDPLAGVEKDIEPLPFDCPPKSLATMPPEEVAVTQLPHERQVSGGTLQVLGLSVEDINSLDPEKLEKLLALSTAMEDRQAEREFAKDFAEFQGKVPQIPKRGIGNHDAPFALYEDIRRAVDPVLSGLGFSISFGALELSEGVARMTGTLRHKSGHKLTESISLPVAKDLRANDTQKGGSAASYCQRYLTKAMLGLVDCGEDDDGNAAGTETVTQEQGDRLMELFSQISDPAKKRFLAWGGCELGGVYALPAGKFAEAERALGKVIRKEAQDAAGD